MLTVCNLRIVLTGYVTSHQHYTDDFSFCFWSTGSHSYLRFSFLMQEEQFMYPSSLHNERFKVAIVNCNREGSGPGDALVLETEGTSWEITRALKCD